MESLFAAVPYCTGLSIFQYISIIYSPQTASTLSFTVIHQYILLRYLPFHPKHTYPLHRYF